MQPTRSAPRPWSASIHIRDVHCTWLNLLGLDDNKLTYYHAGRHKQLSQFGGESLGTDCLKLVWANLPTSFPRTPIEDGFFREMNRSPKVFMKTLPIFSFTLSSIACWLSGHEPVPAKPFGLAFMPTNPLRAHSHLGWSSHYFSEGRDALNGRSLWSGSLEAGYDHFPLEWYGQDSDQSYREWKYSWRSVRVFSMVDAYAGFTLDLLAR